MLLNLFSWLSPYPRSNKVNDEISSKPKVPVNNTVKPAQNKAKQMLNTTSNSTHLAKGNPWLAVFIALLITSYLLFLLFSWISQETIFQLKMFNLNLSFAENWLPKIINQATDTRFVSAKLLTFYLSYPLVFILVYLVYQWVVTSLHWLGCYSAKLKYVTPEIRLKGVAFTAEIAPVFGLMSSLWALMNKGGGDSEYVRWVMCGPSFLGMAAYAMALVYLHWVPKGRG